MEIVKYFTDNFLFFISLIIAIIAVIYSIKNHKFQTSLAEQQGVFQSPDIQLTAYQSVCRLNNILIATKILKEGIILFPLSITLTNKGSKSGKEIHLRLQVHKNLSKCCKMSVTKYDPNLEKNPTFSESSNFQFVDTHIGTLTPKDTFSFMYEIVIDGSTLNRRLNVDAVTKDGFPVKISVEYSLFHVIEYIISQDDSTPIEGLILIGIVDTSQMSLEDHINLENTRKEEEYSKLNLYKKFKLLMNYKERCMLAVTYDESKIKYEANGQIGIISAKDLEYYYYSEDWIGRKHYIRGVGYRTVEPLFPHL